MKNTGISSEKYHSTNFKVI